VHQAFGTVVFIVCGVAIVAAVAALVRSGKTWEDYGKNRLLLDGDHPGASGSAAQVAERDAEIRELLQARNARRVRRGEPPIDVEQELARLTASRIDSALRDEIRDLVIARNHRRARGGKATLDVESEVEREIAALRDLGADGA
jgi:hypothetical protein